MPCGESTENQPLPRNATSNGSPVVWIALYYRAGPDLEPFISDEVQLLQGARELSNVEPVRELVQLINVERNYKHIGNYLNLEDERAREAIRNLTR